MGCDIESQFVNATDYVFFPIDKQWFSRKNVTKMIYESRNFSVTNNTMSITYLFIAVNRWIVKHI